jgi:hypothetical protein
VPPAPKDQYEDEAFRLWALKAAAKPGAKIKTTTTDDLFDQ